MDETRNDDAMTDGDVAEFARGEANRQARVLTGGAIVIAVIGVAFVVAWVVAIRTPMERAFSVSARILGSGLGLLIGAGLLFARARKARRGLTR